jgi:hypothetical protein
VVEGARVLRQVPAAAGSGDLQPRSGHGTGQEDQYAKSEQMTGRTGTC